MTALGAKERVDLAERLALQHGKSKHEESGFGGTIARVSMPISGWSAVKKKQANSWLDSQSKVCLRRSLNSVWNKFAKTRLVGGGVISDDQAIGVAAAHLRVKVICQNAVSHSYDGGLNNPAMARHLIRDFKKKTLPGPPQARSISCSIRSAKVTFSADSSKRFAS